MKKLFNILAVSLFSLFAIEASAQMTNIPDANFLQALKDLGHGTGAVGNNIPTANLKTISTLNISEKNISDLTGIQDFVALKELYCYKNQLQRLNLSKNTALTVLHCYDNSLKTLDVSKNSLLEVLKCSNNLLKTIDIRNGNNEKISTFNATNNPHLTRILVDDKGSSCFSIWKVDSKAEYYNDEFDSGIFFFHTHVPDNNFLEALKNLGLGTDAIGNYVPTVNLSAITFLNIGSANIINLTGIEAFTELETLSCPGNLISNLNLTSNLKLKNIECYNSAIETLDISKNLELVYLDAHSNELKTINVSANEKLRYLDISSNHISLLDLSARKPLSELYCSGNELISLDFSKSTILKKLDCSNNLLKSLNMKNGKNENLTNFDVTNNPDLSCVYVDDKSAAYLTSWKKDATSKFVNDESECSNTSVNDIRNQSISIFPNPTKGIINFDLSGENVQKIMILDIMGKTILEKNMLNLSETIDLSAFANGMYLVILQIDKENRMFKLVKQ